MRIKQNTLIGKTPVIQYEDVRNGKTVIVQIFKDPCCCNMITKVGDKVIERQCYPLSAEQYQAYIDSYNKYKDKRVDGLYANAMANASKDNLMKIFWKKVRNMLWHS